MHELNRVFDGDDLAAALAVDQVHQVIERRRLARAGRAGDQHQAVGLARQVVNLLRQPQFLARGDALAAKAEAHFRMPVAPVERGPDPPGGAVQQRNAQLPFLLELLLLLLVEQARRPSRVISASRQRVLVGDDDLAVDAEGGRHAGHEVQVRGVEFVGGGQQPVQVFGAHRLKSRRHQPRRRDPMPRAGKPAPAPVPASWQCGFSCRACVEGVFGPGRPSPAPAGTGPVPARAGNGRRSIRRPAAAASARARTACSSSESAPPARR